MKQYDKSPLMIRLTVESIAAILSALSVAPAISIIDKAIVSNASGRENLFSCLTNGFKSLLFNPIYFLKQPSFIFIWFVYSGTYIVANSVDAICEKRSSPSFYPKFIGGSVANVSLSVIKDKAFARMFGVGDPKPMLMSSMTLFALRDSLTVLASFSLPGILSSKLQNEFKISQALSDTSSQIFTPVAMQVITSPLHLLGLDIYNRDYANTKDRVDFVKSEYLKTTLARMSRIFPAYGIGGVLNKFLRLEGKKILKSYYS